MFLLHTARSAMSRAQDALQTRLEPRAQTTKPCFVVWAPVVLKKIGSVRVRPGPDPVRPLGSSWPLALILGSGPSNLWPGPWPFRAGSGRPPGHGLVARPMDSLMMIGRLQYYCQSSTNCQILGYSQSIAIQAAVCELDTI